MSFSLCGKASNFWSRTENLKFMYSQLMTLAKCESKGFSISDASCRVCKYADEYENLRHLLLDCKEPQIIDARRRFVFSVDQATKQYASHISSRCRVKNALILLNGTSIRFLMHDHPTAAHIIEEQTFSVSYCLPFYFILFYCSLE